MIAEANASPVIEVGRLQRLRPRVNFAALHHTAPGQSWGPRTIPDCQLVYVLSGRAQLQLGPHAFDLSPGSCAFYGQRSPHRLVSAHDEPCAIVSIHFSWDAKSPAPVHPAAGIRNCAEGDLDQPPPAYRVGLDDGGHAVVPHVAAVPQLERWFRDVVGEYALDGVERAATLTGLMLCILAGLVREHTRPQRSPASLARVRPALDAVAADPGRRWRVDELAQLCGYHPTHFAALFRDGTGESPKRYLLEAKIRRAQALLLTPLGIAEVAEQAGFGSLPYFCRAFKAETGLTPTAYRRTHAVL